MIGFIL